MQKSEIQEMLELLSKAERLERIGSEEQALEIYLRVHKEFDPTTTNAFERPGLLLEKRRRYQEALAIYEKALQYIEEERLIAQASKFEKKVTRIKEKLGKEPQKKETKDRKGFSLLPPGFRSKDPGKIFFSSLVYIGSIVSFLFTKSIFATISFFLVYPLIVYSLDIFRKGSYLEYRKTLTTIFIIITVMIISIANIEFGDPYGKIDVEMDNLKGGFDENPFTGTKEAALSVFDIDEIEVLPIHIEQARRIVERNFEVLDSAIYVEENTIMFVLYFGFGTEESRAKDISEEFVEALGETMASYYPELKGPSFLSYGDLYKGYNFIVGSFDEIGEVTSFGTKSIFAKRIHWH